MTPASTLERARGWVLRTRLLTETSLIVHWLTAEQGRVATVAKGARRPKSPYRGKLDLFYLADFTFQRSRRSDLHQLRELSLRETHPSLRRDLPCLQQAAYGVRLLETTTESDTPIPALYTLFTEFLRHLVSHPPSPNSILAFELKRLDEAGLLPTASSPALDPGTHLLRQHLSQGDWPFIHRLHLTGAQVRRLDAWTQNLLLEHFGQLLPDRSRALNWNVSQSGGGSTSHPRNT